MNKKGAQGSGSGRNVGLYKNCDESSFFQLVTELWQRGDWAELINIPIESLVDKPQSNILLLYMVCAYIHSGEEESARSALCRCNVGFSKSGINALLKSINVNLEKARGIVDDVKCHDALSSGGKAVSASKRSVRQAGQLSGMFKNKKGKMTDKWSSYIEYYDDIFIPYKEKANRLLEIGIQNGGSLEIWEEYFSSLNLIVGVDINEKCKNLLFEGPIRIVVGDVNAKEVYQEIALLSKCYDIIIDDGSHVSSDVISSFCSYFPLLSEDGMYVVEDAHCSYWADFGGGLYKKDSSVSFFKNIVDIINFEHWSNVSEVKEFLEDAVGLAFSEDFISSLFFIREISFANSIIAVKRTSSISSVGERIVVGDVGLVTGVEHKKAHGGKIRGRLA